MKKIRKAIKVISFTSLAAFAVQCSVFAASAETGQILPADSLKWQDVPNVAKIKMAVLMGDPSQAGSFILRIKLPAGFVMSPHTHPVNEYNTVISGSYNIGFGEKFDKSKATHILPGTFVVIPANVPHYGWTDDGAILQADAVGPWGMTPIKNMP